MIERTKLHRVLQSIEARHGPFVFAALFKREDLPTLWDLVVSAPWLPRADLPALDRVAKPVSKALRPKELHSLSRIVTLNRDDPVLKRILKELGPVHKPVEKVGRNLFGLPVEQAYVFRAVGARPSTKRAPPSASRPRRSRSTRAEVARSSRSHGDGHQPQRLARRPK